MKKTRGRKSRDTVPLTCANKSKGNIGILRANPSTLEDSYWLLHMKAYTISLVSADQYKQISIACEEQHHYNMRINFIQQNENFEKSHELKGQSEKFKNSQLFLVRD
jgi:hypothetical protein